MHTRNRRPLPSSFIVTNSNGEPMGRMTITAPFGPVPLQFAACFPLVDASKVADQIGGKVHPAPMFDDTKGDWVIPSADLQSAQ